MATTPLADVKSDDQDKVPTITTSPYVVSDINLGCFMKWANEAAEKDINAVMDVVSITDHIPPPVPEFLGFCPVVHKPPLRIFRPDIGKVYYIKEKTCEEEGCHRCISGGGGYHFRWIGPWTCPASVGDKNSNAMEIQLAARACRCACHM